jgi:hypothetical protein
VLCLGQLSGPLLAALSSHFSGGCNRRW